MFFTRTVIVVSRTSRFEIFLKNLNEQFLISEIFIINIKRVTQDIDNVNPMEDEKIIEKIHNIGERRGSLEWFDFSAPTIDLPDGYRGRLVKVDGLSNIDIFTLHLSVLCKSLEKTL